MQLSIYLTSVQLIFRKRDDFSNMCQTAIEFWNGLQTVIDRAHEQDGNFHDYWRKFNESAMHSPGQRFKKALPCALTHNYTIILSFTVANLPLTAASDQHD